MKKTNENKRASKKPAPKMSESVIKAAKKDLRDFENQSREAFLQRLEMERKLGI